MGARILVGDPVPATRRAWYLDIVAIPRIGYDSGQRTRIAHCPCIRLSAPLRYHSDLARRDRFGRRVGGFSDALDRHGNTVKRLTARVSRAGQLGPRIGFRDPVPVARRTNDQDVVAVPRIGIDPVEIARLADRPGVGPSAPLCDNADGTVLCRSMARARKRNPQHRAPKLFESRHSKPSVPIP